MPFRVRVEYQAQAVDGHRGWRGTETPGWRGESQPEGRRGCVRLGTTVRTGARVEGALTSGAGIGAICRPLTDWLQSRVEARTCGSGLHLVNDRGVERGIVRAGAFSALRAQPGGRELVWRVVRSARPRTAPGCRLGAPVAAATSDGRPRDRLTEAPRPALSGDGRKASALAAS